MNRPPPRTTLFPYTTLFRSGGHDRVQPAGADVLHALVRLGGDAGDLLDAVVRELERRALGGAQGGVLRSEEHTSELQSPYDLVCRLLLEKKKQKRKEFMDLQ